MGKKSLEGSTQKELEIIIDACSDFYWNNYNTATDKIWGKMSQLREKATKILKTKYNIDYDGIKTAYEKWKQEFVEKQMV